MQDYSVNLIIQTIWLISKIFFDIGIMWFLLYYVLKIIKNNLRTIQIFKGILVVILVDALSKLLGFTTVSHFAGMFINWGFLGIIIIFQTEIRGILEKVGKTNAFNKFNVLLSNEKQRLAQEVYEAATILSKCKVGAIISIEQGQSMQDYIKTGVLINSEVSKQLLSSIFMTTTPLHDGGVIIQGNKIACASAYFPPTVRSLPSRYGARHRAALGISEVTDCLTVVVSEETSEISIAEKGKMFHVTEQELKDYLNRVICDEEIEIKNKRQRSSILIDDEVEFVIEKDLDVPKDGLFKRLSKRFRKTKNNQEEFKQSIENDMKVPVNNRDKQVEVNSFDEEVIIIEDHSDQGGLKDEQ